MEIIKLTTPSISFKLNQNVLELTQKVIVTLKGKIKISKSNDEIEIDEENNIIKIELTQEETNILGKRIDVQINGIYEEEKRWASVKKHFYIDENLFEKVVNLNG